LDREAVTASKSFNAVFGKSSLTGFGVGADVLNVWRRVFVRVSFGHMSESGNRAILSGNQVISLGVPLKMAMTPIEVGAGWRFASPRQLKTLTPYAGGGVLALKYSETSDFANAGENTKTTFNGVFVFGGVDVLVMKILSVGAEVDYRSAPHAAGAGGLSQSYGETNLGGTAVRLLFGIRK
jgi:hypothetical protein